VPSITYVVEGDTKRGLDDTKCGSPTKGATMAGKIPNQHNVKKVGKSLKEKRNEKHAKKDSKKGLLPE
jgi:hypothetical protein